MKVVSRNSALLLGASLFTAALAAPAEARGGHHGWGSRHAAGYGHARGYRHGGHRHASGGNASWYASGHRTANGEHFNPNGLTAAHRSLPFGTMVRVTNQTNGRSVVVRINDRGPFVGGRQIDLARGAARAIGMGGTSYVSMSVVR